MRVVVMGVAGSGKSSVGRAVADRLGLPFLEGDDFHSPESRAKTARGEPLTDEDRGPWLDRLNAELRTRSDGAVLESSALGERHRARLLDGVDNVTLVHLTADADLLRRRLEERGSGAGPELLDSQLDTLEVPADAISVDVTPPLDQVVETVLEELATRR